MSRLRKWRVWPAKRGGWWLQQGSRLMDWEYRKRHILRALVRALALREPSDVMVRIHRKDGSLLETRIFPRDAVPKAWLR